MVPQVKIMKNLKILCLTFDLLLSNINEEIPICSIITGDFNAYSSNWWKRILPTQ